MTEAQNIKNAVAGMGLPVGLTLNVLGNTASYKFYSGSLTAITSPVTIAVQTALGRPGTALYIQNLTASVVFTVAFSVDGGTVYGDEINVRSDAVLNLDNWLQFSHIRLTRVSADSSYEVLVR